MAVAVSAAGRHEVITVDGTIVKQYRAINGNSANIALTRNDLIDKRAPRVRQVADPFDFAVRMKRPELIAVTDVKVAVDVQHRCVKPGQRVEIIQIALRCALPKQLAVLIECM